MDREGDANRLAGEVLPALGALGDGKRGEIENEDVAVMQPREKSDSQ